MTVVKKIKDKIVSEISEIRNNSNSWKSENEAPAVKIDGLEFIDSSYSFGGKKWEATKLYEFAYAKGYKVFDLPLVGINLASKAWTVESFAAFLHHAKRVYECELNKPVLLDNDGYICDGWHRVAKAILNGNRYIKAIRLEEMPEPSSLCDNND